MSLKTINTLIHDYEVPYYPFPKDPDIINIEGRKAFEYINKEKLDNIIKNFSYTHNLNQFKYLCINMIGGLPFANDLLKYQNFKGEIITIEYHQNGQIVTPIPKYLCGDPELCCIDDVLDQYITGTMIQKDSPNAKLIYLARKINVHTVQPVHDCQWAVEVDNHWLLGKGLNGETTGDGYPKDWGRNYGGIAVKIPTL